MGKRTKFDKHRTLLFVSLALKIRAASWKDLIFLSDIWSPVLRRTKDMFLSQSQFMDSKRMKSSDGTWECQEQENMVVDRFSNLPDSIIRTWECQEQENMVVDRFSNLPDSIIHYILSFVPTIDVIRMSLLSKFWRHVWASVPKLEFYDCLPGSFKRIERRKFVSFVENYLEHRKQYSPLAGLFLNRFKLKMQYRFYGCYNPIASWLSRCIENTLKELHICIKPYPETEFYHLPEFVLQRTTSLTVLKLKGLRLSGLSSVSLPSLINLSLKHMQMDDKTLHNLLLGCPNVNNLLISECCGIKNVQISNLNIKSFEIDYSSYSQILVEASNLRSFLCRSNAPYGRTRSINLAACGRLTNLSLYAVIFNDELLEVLVPRLPLLESLVIHECSGFNELKIGSQSLKCLYLRYCPSDIMPNPHCTMNASIDTPNLVSFKYEGVVVPKFVILAPNLEKPEIRFFDFIYNKEYFSNLVDFLQNFHCCRSMTLYARKDKALVFQKRIRKKRSPPLPSLKSLEISARGLKEIGSVLRDALLWCAPSVENLSVGR